MYIKAVHKNKGDNAFCLQPYPHFRLAILCPTGPSPAGLSGRIESWLTMLSWPLGANCAFFGSATAPPGGGAIAAMSISGSFRAAIAVIQLPHQSIMLARATLFCLFCIINGHITPL